MGKIIRGKKLMLFVKETDTYNSIAFATNHSFSTSASTINVSHKDLADIGEGQGKWEDADLDTFNWSITSEHLYANEAEGIGCADLWNYYAAGTVLDLKFGVAADNTAGVPTGGWVAPVSGTVLSGKAIISSIDLNAPVDDNSSFSLTFQGKGPLSVGA